MTKIALVGCGRISERHFQAIQELADHFELVAVCDTNFARAESLGKRAGCPSYANHVDMLSSGLKIDLIAVLVESGKHFEIAMDLVKYGVPVLVEKPLTLSTASAYALVDEFNAHDVPLFVVKQNRLNPPVVEALESIRNGECGRVLAVNASVLWCRPMEYYLQDSWRLLREQDGGVIWNQASHYVDLVSLILGEVDTVFAFGDNFQSPAESEDTVHAVIRAKSGIISSIQASTCARPSNFEGTITILTEKEVIRIGGHALNNLERSSTSARSSDILKTAEENPNEVYGKGHAGVYSSVALDLHGVKTSQFRAELGVQVIAIMESIHLSISEGAPVAISRLSKTTI